MKNTPINESTPKNAPPRSDSAQKRAPKQQIPTQRKQRGRGGHASEPENTPNTRKEPENTPETIPFIPKGALMHTKRGVYSYQKTPRAPHTHQSIQPITTIEKQERNFTIITPGTNRFPKPEWHFEKTLSTPHTDEWPWKPQSKLLKDHFSPELVSIMIIL